MSQDVLAATINGSGNSLFFNNLKVLCVKFSGFDFEEKGQAATLYCSQYRALCHFALSEQSSDVTGSMGCVLVLFIYLFLCSRTCREPVCCDVDGEDPTRGGGTIFMSCSHCQFEPIAPALCISRNRCWKSYIKRILSALQNHPPTRPHLFSLPPAQLLSSMQD